MHSPPPTQHTQGHSVVAAPVHSEPLAHLIAHEIRAQGGWLPFDRFMELALYAPGLGYYSGGQRVLGRSPQDGSDFVTAPELTPLFGQALARQVEQALAATGTDQIYEFGAGSGALAEQLLASLGDRIQRYTIVDLSGTLRDRQHQRLVKAQPELVHKVIWADTLPEVIEGVVVGNEVLDAMPVNLLRWDGQHWLERGVALANSSPGAAPSAAPGPAPNFVWADRPTRGLPGANSLPGRPVTERPDSEFAPGTVTETHAQAEAFVATLAARMSRGAAFFIDYGFPEAEYHHPQRTGGTLMCHHRHTADANPLAGVGHKDITAHINFTGIALAGQDAGWTVLGYTNQGRFLANCGLVQGLPEHPTAATLQERAAVQMLLAEHEMGELFKVIGFVKGEWFDAIGFAQGDRTHTL